MCIRDRSEPHAVHGNDGIFAYFGDASVITCVYDRPIRAALQLLVFHYMKKLAVFHGAYTAGDSTVSAQRIFQIIAYHAVVGTRAVMRCGKVAVKLYKSISAVEIIGIYNAEILLYGARRAEHGMSCTPWLCPLCGGGEALGKLI